MEDKARFDRWELFDPENPDPALGNIDDLKREYSGSKELASRVARVKRSDALIRQALAEIEIPAGLRNDVRERIALEVESEERERAAVGHEPPPTLPMDAPSASRARRRFLWTTTGGLAAASLLIAAIWYARPRASLPMDELSDNAATIHRQFHALAETPGDIGNESQFPSDFNRAYFKSCKQVDFMGRRVRGYLFANQRHAVLVLMVPERRFPRDIELPVTTFRSEQGLTIHCVADRPRQMVRVVVFDGDPRDLQRFKSTTPLT